MTSVSLTELRNQLHNNIAAAQREPVEIVSRGASRRAAVLVSADFFDRAIEALEDQDDVRAAAEARQDSGPTISHEQLIAELNQ